MNRHCVAGAVFDVLQTRLRTNLGQPRRARRRASVRGKRRSSSLVSSRIAKIGAAVSNDAAALRMQCRCSEGSRLTQIVALGLSCSDQCIVSRSFNPDPKHDQEIERRVQQMPCGNDACRHSRRRRARADGPRGRRPFARSVVATGICQSSANCRSARRRVGMLDARSPARIAIFTGGLPPARAMKMRQR